eukprot:g47521.t1
MTCCSCLPLLQDSPLGLRGEKKRGEKNRQSRGVLAGASYSAAILFAAHEEFSKSKQSNTDANQREEMLKKLAAGHDQFVELVNNLKEGTKFYNGITEFLLKFQTKCTDIVFARKTERDELL